MNVRRYLHFQELRQQDIALHLGISQPHVSEVFAGRKPLSLRKCVELADLLGVSVDKVARAFLRTEDEFNARG